MRTAIISPVYNEENCLLKFYNRLNAVIDRKDVFFADDGSNDNTLNILNKIHIPQNIFVNKWNKGQGVTISESLNKLKLKDYDYAITIDSDLQHNPEDIVNFIKALNQNRNADLIVGSRYQKFSKAIGDQNFLRCYGNALFKFLFGQIYSQNVTDFFSGFLMINLNRTEFLSINSNSYSWTLEFWHKIFKNNLLVLEIPIDRIYLDSNRNYKEQYKSTYELLYDMLYTFIKNTDHSSFLSNFDNILYDYFNKNKISDSPLDIDDIKLIVKEIKGKMKLL